MARDTATRANTEVTDVKSSVASVSESLRAQDAEVAEVKKSVVSVGHSVQAEEKRVTSLEEPTTIHYKGLTLTPGGFPWRRSGC